MIINVKHLIGAAGYSLAGLKRAWQAEQAFRHEVLLIPVIIVLLIVIRPGFGWSAAVAAGWCLVMALELLNSAVEEVFDLTAPDFNIHAKHGKDLASAAIFVGLCGNALLWGFMLCDVYL